MTLERLREPSHEVLTVGGRVAYAPTGHLVFDRNTAVWALPFDIRTLTNTDAPFQIAIGGVGPSVASDGTLVYVDRGKPMQQLVWRSRGGQFLGTAGEPQPGMRSPSLSPSGDSIAVDIGLVRGKRDIWVHDANRPIARRLTFGERQEMAAYWSPDGTEVAYRGQSGIQKVDAGGGGDPSPLSGLASVPRPYGWSPDGKYFLYSRASLASGSSQNDIYYVPMNGDERSGESTKILGSPFEEVFAQLSPNGRWLAFGSDQSGAMEIYVTRFPDGGQQWPISRGGGQSPRWSSDGRELYYVQGDSMIAVPVGDGDDFTTGEHATLFAHPALLDETDRYLHVYAVSEDGRFLLVEDAPDAQGYEPPSIHVVENWFEEFRDRVER